MHATCPILAVFLFVLLPYGCAPVQQRAQDMDVWEPSSIPVYVCHEVPCEKIEIDGKLDETCWRHKPKILFAGLKNGEKPRHDGHARIIWDSNYLYVGYKLIQPDIWATVKDVGEGKESQREIMRQDLFVKFFIDPDGDSLDYLEWHINPANALADLILHYPYHDYARQESGLPLKVKEPVANWNWYLQGVKTGVYIDGTINNSKDRDRAWFVEMAIPWTSLDKHAKSPCPPRNVKTWRAHLGRIHRSGPGKPITYWTWPVLGMMQCHVPARWGVLYFKEQTRSIRPRASGQRERSANSERGEMTDLIRTCTISRGFY